MEANSVISKDRKRIAGSNLPYQFYNYIHFDNYLIKEYSRKLFGEGIFPI